MTLSYYHSKLYFNVCKVQSYSRFCVNMLVNSKNSNTVSSVHRPESVTSISPVAWDSLITDRVDTLLFKFLQIHQSRLILRHFLLKPDEPDPLSASWAAWRDARLGLLNRIHPTPRWNRSRRVSPDSSAELSEGWGFSVTWEFRYQDLWERASLNKEETLMRWRDVRQDLLREELMDVV